MKVNMKTLFLCSILLTAVFASTECTSHKGWTKVKAFLKDFTSSDSTLADGLNNMIAAFENSTPAVATADSLGKCSDYVGQKSCCNAAIAKYLDSIVLLKVKPILTLDNMITKLVKYNYKLISLTDCPAKKGVTKPTSADAILANLDNLPALKSLIDGAKPIKIAFAKAVSAFARGAVCLACSGTDSVSQYFNSDDKVILSQASVKAFTDAASAALTSFNGIVGSKSIVSAAAGILGQYIDSNSQCYQGGVYQAQQFVGVYYYQDKSGASVCTGLNLYVSDTACQQAMGGDSSIDSLTPTIEPSPPARLLAGGNTNDAVQASTSTGGVNAFIVSATDDKITDSGSMTVDTSFSSSKGERQTILSALLLFSLFFIAF